MVSELCSREPPRIFSSILREDDGDDDCDGRCLDKRGRFDSVDNLEEEADRKKEAALTQELTDKTNRSKAVLHMRIGCTMVNN